MSLGDILVEILGEMMGVPIKKKQPPTASRPVAPPPVASSSYGDEDDDVYMYDDDEQEENSGGLFREETPETSWAEPVPQPEFQPSFHIPVTAMAEEPVQQPTRAIPIQREVRESPTKVKVDGLPKGFIESIRTDNAAARAAIVSAEIFGPPVSERKDRQW